MDLEIALDAREALGKANKRLRREGLVPAVVFGNGEESTSVQVDAKTFETLYRAAGRTSVVNLKVPGTSQTKSAVIKGVQRHPVSGQTLHVDFLLVNLRQEMEVDVPLSFSGEAPAVEETGGTLLHNLSSIRVRALPNDIPHEVVVDVSSLASLDDAIHVSDLPLDLSKVTLVTDGETLVATVVPPRIEAEPEVVAEVAEGEEGEGEGEGAAPAEGGAPAEPAESGETPDGESSGS